MWKPPEYPGPCFEAEKPFENVCATGAFPVQLREYLFLHLFDCKPQNIVAVVVHESATAQEAVLLDGAKTLQRQRRKAATEVWQN